MTETPRLLCLRYELGELLGSGGMADVRRAHDTVLHRDVAIKLLRTGDRIDRERFDTEARLLALLTHPNVVTVLDAGVDDGTAWLALELVDGGTMADRLAAGAVSPTVLATLGSQIAGALAHAHSHSVVHRDVKPANVLIDDAGRARLTDFGIARLADGGSALTMTGHTIGTAAYLAPEQVAGERVTTASDVYALGLLLLEGLTGHREYAGPPVEAALARLQRSPLVPVSLPTGWPGLIAMMTARAPEDRPTAGVVAERLRALAGVAAVETVLPGPDPTTTVHVAGVAGVAGVAAFAGFAGSVLASDASPSSHERPDDRHRSRLALAGVAGAVALVVALSVVLFGGAPGGDGSAAASNASATATATTQPTPASDERTPKASPASPAAAATPAPSPVAAVRTTASQPVSAPRPAPTRRAPSRAPVRPTAGTRHSTKHDTGHNTGHGTKHGGRGGSRGKRH